MQQDDASFWADIKNYEERLAQAPDSYLFARLAEVYLKVGLVDDALHTARQGVTKYPDYIYGQRVLALASSAKGLHDESREALEKVITAQPEDRESQMMLGRILSVDGNTAAAISSFRTVLEFNPEDMEARLELESLERNAGTTAMDTAHGVAEAESVEERLDTGFVAFEEAPGEEVDEIIELLESDIIEEEEEPENILVEPSAPVAAHHDPLSTMTLAELYEQQGFTEKALGIYRAIMSDDPTNSEVRLRIARLEHEETSEVTAPSVMPVVEDAAFNMDFQEPTPVATALPAQGSADNTVAILEEWLENVRRIKACL